MTTQTEITQRNHRRAVRFFWCFLIGATTVSLAGNIAHAVLPYLPRIVIQIGAAAVPPIALLAAVHGIALAVRAGASGRIYCWAIGAVSAIGVGAFALSFLALRDLMQVQKHWWWRPPLNLFVDPEGRNLYESTECQVSGPTITDMPQPPTVASVCSI